MSDTPTLTVASYNMRKAVGLDRRRNPARVLQVLEEIDADIVALQEADKRVGTRGAAVPHALIDDVLAMATRPVLVSHTGVEGTCAGTRNLSDRHLQAIAATGGVVGIGYWSTAVCDTSVAAIVKAIRYTADKIGVEHVALGSDFNGTIEAPFDVTGLPQLTEGLLAAGFNQQEIAAIMGGNVQRLLLASLPEQ